MTIILKFCPPFQSFQSFVNAAETPWGDSFKKKLSSSFSSTTIWLIRWSLSLIVCSCSRKIQVWPCVPLISREVPCCFCKMLNTSMFFLVVATDLQCYALELNFSSSVHPPFGNRGTHHVGLKLKKKSLNVSQSNSHVCFTQKCCSSLGSSVYRSHSVWQTQGFHSIAGSLSNPSNDKKHTGSL